MNYVGIDIGSTASKVSVIGDKEINFVTPTGWSSKEVANDIKKRLLDEGVDVENENTRVTATGYGRISVDFADFVITEITCHARGARALSGLDNLAVIDVGGQDTKAILIEDKLVSEFQMNDKCSAGTGKFIEVMANKLGLTIAELFDLAQKGEAISISSMCTVFAETEITSYVGEGRKKEDIAAGIVNSVAQKVSQMYNKIGDSDKVILTGGLSQVPFFAEILSQTIGKEVINVKNGQFAGSIGGAYLSKEKKKR
ncbi:acyl-CoA dehydratase activase [Anaerococcus sp.]|uniref:acyl-CoA dehydratase activase n=1 Tax=Anaerococcus sp. TaxID=1872515 RepID=UPI0027BA8FD2|nr:acyl-CoA dehydratase activase [Anaerococcus sp.]MDU3136836.1 acyl-CoA dehydratase activase [Anaerococcus prevotii]